MLKHLFFSSLGLIAALPLLTGCKADDGPISDSVLWEGSIAEAPYTTEAICLNVSNAPVATIEMSENGLYFITPVGYDSYSSPRAAMRRNASAKESVYRIISGSFSILPDGSFDCKGYGIVKWNATDNTVAIELEDGGHYIWDAEAAQKLSPNALDSRLCRTWKIETVTIEFYDWDDDLIQTYSPSKETVESEYINYFTFTSSKRAYTFDDEDGWSNYSWSWINPVNQIITMIADNDEDGDGIMQVFFKDNDIRIMLPSDYDPYEYEDFDGFTAPNSSVAYVIEYFNCTNYIP